MLLILLYTRQLLPHDSQSSSPSQNGYNLFSFFFFPSSLRFPFSVLSSLFHSLAFLRAVKPPSEGKGKVNKQSGELAVQPQRTVQPSGSVPTSLTGCLRQPSANTLQMCFSHTPMTRVNPRCTYSTFMYTDNHKININISTHGSSSENSQRIL